MSSLLRPSTRQLARSVNLTIRSASRPAPRTARLARTLSAQRFTQTPRYYSSNPPRKDSQDEDKAKRRDNQGVGDAKGNQDPRKDASEAPPDPNPEDGKANANAAEGGQSELLPGWVRLTEEDIATLKKICETIPKTHQGVFKDTVETLMRVGAPQDLRDLLAKAKDGGLTLGDSLKALRTARILAKRLSEIDETLKSDTNKPPHDEGQFTQNQGKQWESRKTGSQEQKGDGKGEKGQKDQPQGQFYNVNMDMVSWIVAAAVLYPLYRWLVPGENSREITWQELRKNFLDKGLVEKLVVIGDRVRVELNREAAQAMYPDTVAANPSFYYYFSIGSVDAFERRLEEAQSELGIPSSERIPVSYSTPGTLAKMLVAFGPTAALILLTLFALRQVGGGRGGSGGMFGFGKSKAKMFNHESAVKVKFADVAGMDEAKVEIMEFVSFLKSPEKFNRLGAKIPRGAILSGPPGTGKTLLAKATAGESQVPFFTVSGSEFVEMFVGVGASRVRDLFATARKNAPCIIFIDEIDAIGKERGDGRRFGGNDEREATLNQILTEMDGFNTTEQVVVLAGTNRPDTLDKALMRPGRFDRHIHIDRPTMKGRQDIFLVHLKKIVTNEDMEHLTGRLAALTPGFAGADIANAVNEAALIAARANAQTVEMIHFEQAIERVIGGLERKSLVLSPEDKKVVAYHEAGHAICGWYFQYADPLLKVSIIPRGQGALGYAQYLPGGDEYLMNVRQLMDRMAMTLGGRISEELHFPTVTTGASDDFKKVTRLATTMVTQWGMSDKLGPLHFNNDQNQLQKPFAESTAQTIDAEVRRIVDDAYRQCRELLVAKKKEIGLVAEELLRKEMLTRDDMVRLLGPRPFPEKEEFSKYFSGQGTTAGKGTVAPPPFPAERDPDPPAAPDDVQPAVFRGLEDGEGRR